MSLQVKYLGGAEGSLVSQQERPEHELSGKFFHFSFSAFFSLQRRRYYPLLWEGWQDATGPQFKGPLGQRLPLLITDQSSPATEQQLLTQKNSEERPGGGNCDVVGGCTIGGGKAASRQNRR